jgi:hypothetical protein
VEDGAKVVGDEIVKGAEAVVDAVEKHPELIAEFVFFLILRVLADVLQRSSCSRYWCSVPSFSRIDRWVGRPCWKDGSRCNQGDNQ